MFILIRIILLAILIVIQLSKNIMHVCHCYVFIYVAISWLKYNKF